MVNLVNHSNIGFFEPPKVEKLEHLRDILGGSGGVKLFKDPETGILWTEKSWRDRGAAINECLAARLYQILGGDTPDFHLSDQLRYARFIEGRHPTPAELQERLPSLFLPIAFLSIWDIKPENYILTPDGKLYLVDTGGSLFYRAVNGRKEAAPENWMPYQVSELRTLRERDYFSGIDNSVIKQQIRPLLQKREEILNAVKDFCHSTQYNQTQELLHSLQSRMRHLEFVEKFLNGTLNPKADPFELASVNDAAGTLIHANRGGRSCILMGKRVRHDWWCNPGGAVDLKETFFDTATRETREETNGHFDYEGEILFAPSHDMVTVEEQLVLKRYRTYLVEGDSIDLKGSTEFTEFKWIPVEEILQALTNPDAHQCVEEGKPTLQVDECILYPPFLDSLKQSKIQSWLRCLAEGKKVEATCTQSVNGRTDLKEVEGRIAHSASEALGMAVWMSEVLKRKKIEPLPAPPSQEVPTASYSMLRHHLAYTSLRVEEQVQIVVKNYARKDLEGSDVKRIIEVIDEEKRHPNKHVIVHGLMPELWFQYRVLSIMRHMMNGTPVQTDMLRSLDAFFEEFKSAEDLIEFIEEGRDNYSSGFKRAGMSFNPSLFSNLETPSSETLLYWLGQRSASPPHNIWDIGKTTFDQANLSSDPLLVKLREVYQAHFGQKGVGGALLQVFLDPTIVNQVCYIAGSLGKTIQDQSGNTVKDALSVFDQIKVGKDPQLSRPMRKLQVRLLADLARFNPGLVVVKDYFSFDGVSVPAIDRTVKQLLYPHIFRMLRHLPFSSDVYCSREPGAVQVQRKVMGLQPFERRVREPQIARAFREGKFFNVILQLLDNPKWLDYEIVNPDTLEKREFFPHDKERIKGVCSRIDRSDRLALARELREVFPDLENLTVWTELLVGASNVTPSQRKQVFTDARDYLGIELMTRSTSNIYRTLGEMNPPERKQVCKLTVELEMSTSVSPSFLLTCIHGVIPSQRDSVAAHVKACIKPKITGRHVSLLFDWFSKMDAKDRPFAAKWVKNLVLATYDELPSIMRAIEQKIEGLEPDVRTAVNFYLITHLSEIDEWYHSAIVEAVWAYLSQGEIYDGQIRVIDSIIQQICSFKEVIIPGMTREAIMDTHEASLAIDSADRAKVLGAVKRLLESEKYLRSKVPEVLEVMNALKDLYHLKMETRTLKGIYYLSECFDESAWKGAIRVTKGFVETNHTQENEIPDIFKEFSRINPVDHSDILLIASELIEFGAVEKDHFDILGSLEGINPSNREAVVASTKRAIRKGMDGSTIRNILHRFSEIPSEEHDSVYALCQMLGPEHPENYLCTVGEIDRLKRKVVVETTKEMVTPKMDCSCVHALLRCLSKHDEKDYPKVKHWFGVLIQQFTKTSITGLDLDPITGAIYQTLEDLRPYDYVKRDYYLIKHLPAIDKAYHRAILTAANTIINTAQDRDNAETLIRRLCIVKEDLRPDMEKRAIIDLIYGRCYIPQEVDDEFLENPGSDSAPPPYNVHQ